MTVLQQIVGLGYSKNSNGEAAQLGGSDGALATIELPHYMGHKRKRFIAEKTFTAVAKDASVRMHLVTPATAEKEYHVEIFHSIGATCYVDVVDGTTYGTSQVETLTATGTCTEAADALVEVTAAGMTGSGTGVAVAMEVDDTATMQAVKIRAALAAWPALAAMFAVSGTGADIVLTRLIHAANDATLNMAIVPGDATGVGAVPNSANTTAGVAEAAGTPVTGFNTCRIAPVVTTDVRVYHTPSNITLGTKIRDTGLLEAGKGPNAIGGSGQSRAEVILGPSQDLLVVFTNKDSTGAKDIGIGLDWYEVE